MEISRCASTADIQKQDFSVLLFKLHIMAIKELWKKKKFKQGEYY